MYYTGIGSRNTPEDILELMSKIAKKLETLGYTLRSGGANGADKAFENGVENLKEIYLPWKNFNNNNSEFFNVSDKARDLASKFHPNWSNLKFSVKNLMGRNAYQVLGYNLDKKSEFVICWTPDGCESNKTRSVKLVEQD